MIYKFLAGLAACALPSALAAAADAPDTACELHVWPAPELKSTTQGWWTNDTVDHAFDTSHGGVERPKSLAPESQVEVLRALDLAELIGDAPAKVVIHAEPLPRTAALADTRQSPSTSPCYSELIVSQIFYEHAPLTDRSLRILAVHRRFGDAPQAQSSFSTWAHSTLIHFPPASPDQRIAAEAELVQAYRTDLLAFIDYDRRSRKPKHK
jgi:hypothetical protein